MEVNARVVFEGAAGTGKTFLALEAARRAAKRDRRVLLLCFNRMLGEWLQKQTAPLGRAVTTRTLHSFMLSVSGGQVPAPATERFWKTTLPHTALEAMLDEPGFVPFDELIVDEAQDILQGEYLDVLDLALRGGLAAGTWRFFGDFERQALYESASISLEEFSEQRGGNAARFRLTDNCRNSPRIVELIKVLARVQHGYTRVLRPDTGVEPRLKFYDSPESECEMLAETLKELYDDGFRGRDIVVLSPHADGACAARIGGPPWCDRLAPARDAAAGQIPYTTIHAFKGLEAAAVVVTDVEAVDGPAMESLFYVAITRATDRLVILMDERTKTAVSRLLSTPPVQAAVSVG
jgi:superfamily I DNA/RNA helicase